MLATETLPQYQRRSLRRAVSVECEMESNLWDGQVPFRVTDLSNEGLWLRTGLSIECGEQVVVSFAPPSWPRTEPLVALASVVRVAMPRRRGDHEHSGMGLRLMDLSPDERQLLRGVLRGLPPPLKRKPVLDASSLVSDAEALACPMTYILSREPRFTTAEGLDVTFVAEAPLLTGGRAPGKPRLHVRAAETLTELGDRADDTVGLRLVS